MPTQVRRPTLEVVVHGVIAWFGSSPFVSEAAAPVAPRPQCCRSSHHSTVPPGTETANERTANVRELDNVWTFMHTCARASSHGV